MLFARLTGLPGFYSAVSSKISCSFSRQSLSYFFLFLLILFYTNSIILKEKADTWEEAVKKCISPLVKSNAVEQRYLDAIIKKTNYLIKLIVLIYYLKLIFVFK